MSDNEYIKMQFEQIQHNLNKFEDAFNKVFDKMDKMNSVLARNTVIVDEHQKRSTNLETECKRRGSASHNIEKELLQVKLSVKSREKLEERVKNLETGVSTNSSILKSVPLGFKIVAMFFGLITVSFGLYKMSIEAVQLLNK